MAVQTFPILLLAPRGADNAELRRLLDTASLRSNLDIRVTTGDEVQRNDGTYLVLQVKGNHVDAFAVVGHKTPPPVQIELDQDPERSILTLIELLIKLTKSPDELTEPRIWERSSEELIRLLYNLLDDRDALTEALFKAYGDLRASQGRFQLLEAQLKSLEAERSTTPERWRSPLIVATIAVAITTALGPVLGALTTEAVKEPTEKVVQQAVKVQSDCNVVINMLEPPPNDPELAEALRRSLP